MLNDSEGLKEGRRAQHERHLRHAERVLVRGDGHHASGHHRHTGRWYRSIRPHTACAWVADARPLAREHRLRRRAELRIQRSAPAVSWAPRTTTVRIDEFLFDRGDLTARGATARPPTVAAGQSLKFVNGDEPTSMRFHTITGCRLPCSRSPGVSFPLANGSAFDSGELGFGPVVPWEGERVPFTAALNTASWTTPYTLRPGTDAYFCRIHPFLRLQRAARFLEVERVKRTPRRRLRPCSPPRQPDRAATGAGRTRSARSTRPAGPHAGHVMGLPRPCGSPGALTRMRVAGAGRAESVSRSSAASLNSRRNRQRSSSTTRVSYSPRCAAMARPTHAPLEALCQFDLPTSLGPGARNYAGNVYPRPAPMFFFRHHETTRHGR